MTQNKEARECTDCPRVYHVRPSSKRTLCKICLWNLQEHGTKDVKQPDDPAVYVPRYNGMEHLR